MVAMVAFTLSQPIPRSSRTNSFVSNNRLNPNKPLDRPLTKDRLTPICRAEVPFKPISRRAILSLIAASVVTPALQKTHAERSKDEPYDAVTTRRYVNIGRPAPDRQVPKFATDIPVFKIDQQLAAQDVKTGNGDSVGNGTLVMARWIAVLGDGTTVDDANEKQPALFRPGSHQVPPGIEDAVVGMQAGGVRRVSGSSDRILSNIGVGYNIGERSLVPTGSTMYVDIIVDQVNPFGSTR